MTDTPTSNDPRVDQPEQSPSPSGAGRTTDESRSAPPPPPADWSSAAASASPAMAADARRNWAAAAHWSALVAGLLLGGFALAGPLVVWLVKREQDQWVTRHAVESLNFQLTWAVGGLVAFVAGIVLTIVTVGFALVVLLPAALVLAVLWVVFTIRGALAASRAEEYRYPMSIRMVS